MAKKRYKLVRKIIGIAIVGTITTSILIPTKTNAYIAPYTEEEQATIELFKEELTEIETSLNIEFHNQELFDIVSSKIDGILTTDNIKKINTLTIDKPLSNTDLSDLKYLTNLKFLTIKNNQVDSTYLKYNQNLLCLNITNGSIYNTNELPNTLTSISIKNTSVKDYTLSLPYNLEELNLYNSPVSDISSKNINSLKTLTIKGNTYLSATTLTKFPNLKYLTLNQLLNLNDSSYLTEIPNLKYLSIDDYAPIWLDKDTLSNLPINPLIKDKLLKEISSLDDIAFSISNDEDKLTTITKITNYLINRYTYDIEVSNNTKKGDRNAIEDNLLPIKTSLNNEDIICINYACMFQALCNRLNIDTITLANGNHAWNAFNISNLYTIIDITSIDNLVERDDLPKISSDLLTTILYDFNTSDNYQEYNKVPYPLTKTDTYNNNFGYIKEPSYLNALDKIEKLLYNRYTFNIITNPIKYSKNITTIAIIIYLSMLIYGLKETIKNRRTKRLSR